MFISFAFPIHRQRRNNPKTVILYQPFHDPGRQPFQNTWNPVETTVQHQPGLLPQQRPTLQNPGTECSPDERRTEGVPTNEFVNDCSWL